MSLFTQSVSGNATAVKLMGTTPSLALATKATIHATLSQNIQNSSKEFGGREGRLSETFNISCLSNEHVGFQR